jgi:hypothetical protein
MLGEYEGLNFWNRVDAVRGINNSLKSVAEKAGLNYEVIKVQHSLGRMPRAEEATKIAQALQVPTQWLVLGKCENVIDELRIGKSNENEKMLHLLELIVNSPDQIVQVIENFLTNGNQLLSKEA